MGDMPRNRHGLIPMLVAIRVAGERKRREAAKETPKPDKPEKAKKRGWFG